MKLPHVRPATLLLALLSALIFAAPALRTVSDADVWWHLKAGDAVLSGSPAAFTESWSFTAAGRPWINHEWLAEWRLALARRAGGEPGVVGFAGALLFVTALFLFRAARLEGAPNLLILAGLAFLPLVTGTRFIPRPQIFSYFLLAIWLERLATARRRPRTGWLYLALFPFLQVLWTNLHGPLIGLGVGAILILGGALPSLSWKDRLLLVGSLVIASFVHPQGYRALVDSVVNVAGGGLYNQTINEWLPLFNPQQAGMPETRATMVVIAAAVLLVIVAALRREARRARGYPLLLLLLAVATIASVRNRDLLAIAFVPGAAAISMAAWNGRGMAGAVVASLAAFFFILTSALGLFGYAAAWPPRPALDTRDFPVAAAEFLKREGIGSRIFNAYDYGGYLIDRLAPEHRVFIDGRYFVYGEPAYRDYLEVRDGGEKAREILDRTGADLLLVRYPQPDGYQGLARRARDWSDWSLIFWDDMALVYARNAALAPAWLAEHAFRTVDPTLPSRMEQMTWWVAHLDDILRETGAAGQLSPRAVRPRLVRALAYEYNGLDGDAALVYRSILDLSAGNRPASEGLRRVEARHPQGLPLPRFETSAPEQTPGSGGSPTGSR